MYRVGILEVWQRNVLVDASTKSAAVEAVLSSKVPIPQEGMLYVRVLNPEEWPAESTEPEEILADALAIVGELCAALNMDSGAKRNAIKRAQEWENRFLSFAEAAQEADERTKEKSPEAENEESTGGEAIPWDSQLPPQPGIWDVD